jgi:hypothetical protein
MGSKRDAFPVTPGGAAACFLPAMAGAQQRTGRFEAAVTLAGASPGRGPAEPREYNLGSCVQAC